MCNTHYCASHTASRWCPGHQCGHPKWRGHPMSRTLKTQASTTSEQEGPAQAGRDCEELLEGSCVRVFHLEHDAGQTHSSCLLQQDYSRAVTTDTTNCGHGWRRRKLVGRAGKGPERPCDWTYHTDTLKGIVFLSRETIINVKERNKAKMKHLGPE